jgi:hypothetical protein
MSSIIEHTDPEDTRLNQVRHTFVRLPGRRFADVCVEIQYVITQRKLVVLDEQSDALDAPNNLRLLTKPLALYPELPMQRELFQIFQGVTS